MADNETYIASGTALTFNLIPKRAKNWYELGAMWRSSFRRICMMLDLEYKEEKGFIDSFFVVEGDYNKILQLNDIVTRWSKH